MIGWRRTRSRCHGRSSSCPPPIARRSRSSPATTEKRRPSTSTGPRWGCLAPSAVTTNTASGGRAGTTAASSCASTATRGSGARRCASLEVVHHFGAKYAMPYENNAPILLCRGMVTAPPRAVAELPPHRLRTAARMARSRHRQCRTNVTGNLFPKKAGPPGRGHGSDVQVELVDISGRSLAVEQTAFVVWKAERLTVFVSLDQRHRLERARGHDGNDEARARRLGGLHRDRAEVGPAPSGRNGRPRSGGRARRACRSGWPVRACRPPRGTLLASWTSKLNR
jgi:hypothetical protein